MFYLLSNFSATLKLFTVICTDPYCFLTVKPSKLYLFTLQRPFTFFQLTKRKEIIITFDLCFCLFQIYGIKCHLKYKFDITESDWFRIKRNIDSKCRTIWRRKKRGLPLGNQKVGNSRSIFNDN